MTEKNKERDIKTRYEFLIAGIVVVLLCILAFVAFKITGYLNGARASGTGETTLEASDGTVLIEVAIRETTNPEETVEETEVTEPEEVPVEEIINEHDDIRIFTATTPGENYYKSKEGRLKLYADPKETDEDRPSLMEEAAFEVLGFSRDGWAAISYGGQRYYVKSAEIIPADAPEDWEERHKEAEDSQAVRFFTPVSGNIEYVVTMDTKAFSLPDVMSSGLSTDLKAGERVIVVATDGEWYKIMNPEKHISKSILKRRSSTTRVMLLQDLLMQLQALLLRVRQTRPTQAEQHLMVSQVHPEIQEILVHLAETPIRVMDTVHLYMSFWTMLMLSVQQQESHRLHGVEILNTVHAYVPVSFLIFLTIRMPIT